MRLRNSVADVVVVVVVGNMNENQTERVHTATGNSYSSYPPIKYVDVILPGFFLSLFPFSFDPILFRRLMLEIFYSCVMIFFLSKQTNKRTVMPPPRTAKRRRRRRIAKILANYIALAVLRRALCVCTFVGTFLERVRLILEQWTRYGGTHT